MPKSEKTPNSNSRDLAQRVHTKLVAQRGMPTFEQLEELLQVAYLVSLGREEQAGIHCTFAYASQTSPDPKPPERVRQHRWTYAKLESVIPFVVNNVTKFALAAANSATAIAVVAIKGNLLIHGLFDQQQGYYKSIRHEGGGRFQQPGLFQVEVVGTGHIRVMRDTIVLGELRHAQVASEPVNVFTEGPIYASTRETIKKHVFDAIEKVNDAIDCPMPDDYYADIANFYMSRWITVMQRLLTQTRDHGHGGSYIFMTDDSLEYLNIRYKIVYSRIIENLHIAVVSSVIKNFYEEKLRDALDTDADTIPTSDYLGYVLAESEQEDAETAMTNAIEFVAGLSRIDGLVCMSKDLIVLGFGVEARAPDLIIDAVVSAKAGSSIGKKLLPDRFGTRHRAIMRYCAAKLGAVGFVASEDGPVRAVLATSQRVTIWENIELSYRSE